MKKVGHTSQRVNTHMVNALAINSYLMILCLFLFSVDSHAKSEEVKTTRINEDNQISIKEKLAIERTALQLTSFLLRSVGESKHSSKMFNEKNNKFIIEQEIKFYKGKNFSEMPAAIKKYFDECFLINCFVLNNNPDEKKLLALDERINELKKDLNKYLSQYDMEWDNIIFKTTGKTKSNLMGSCIRNIYQKYAREKIDMNDPTTMESVIKEAYVCLADFLDAESLKLVDKKP